MAAESMPPEVAAAAAPASASCGFKGGEETHLMARTALGARFLKVCLCVSFARWMVCSRVT